MLITTWYPDSEKAVLLPFPWIHITSNWVPSPNYFALPPNHSPEPYTETWPPVNLVFLMYVWKLSKWMPLTLCLTQQVAMIQRRPKDCVYLQRKLFGFQVPVFLFLASRPEAKESWEETPEASGEYALMKLDSNVTWPTEKHRNTWVLPYKFENQSGIWNNESKVIFICIMAFSVQTSSLKIIE